MKLHLKLFPFSHPKYLIQFFQWKSVVALKELKCLTWLNCFKYGLGFIDFALSLNSNSRQLTICSVSGMLIPLKHHNLLTFSTSLDKTGVITGKWQLWAFYLFHFFRDRGEREISLFKVIHTKWKLALDSSEWKITCQENRSMSFTGKRQLYRLLKWKTTESNYGRLYLKNILGMVNTYSNEI